MGYVIVKDLGLIDYMECWKLQQKFFDALISAKTGEAKGERSGMTENEVAACQENVIEAQQMLLLCEHPHVYTLGKSGNVNNLLIDPAFMERIGAAYYRVDRGGDITYHGPGQLVGYPILDLERLGIGLKDYIHRLEQVIINTLGRFGISAARSEGATGVWISGEPHYKNNERDGRVIPWHGNDRKIAAIGVRSSRFVTMHGFSLNVDTKMEYFSYINPCGFTDRGVTSAARELGESPEMDKVKKAFAEEFGKVFELTVKE